MVADPLTEGRQLDESRRASSRIPPSIAVFVSAGEPGVGSAPRFVSTEGNAPDEVRACLFDCVDGRPRAFLDARGVSLPEGLPEGTPADPPEAMTVHGSSNRKNDLLLRRLAEDPVEVFDGSARCVRAARDAGLRTAAVFEDSLAGVQAGRDGGFTFVVGVDRTGQAQELRERGADAVVRDLGELPDST